MRFLFLNQYFPPDPAPTGILLRELADHLAAQGHTVDFVSSGQDYRAAAKKNERRIVREMRALWTILRRGCGAQGRPRPDVVVSGTSPPLLVVAAALVARRHRAKHAHWLFDMYPELAIALGEIPPGALARFFSTITHRALREADLVVTLDADMAARLHSVGARAEIIAPWVFASLCEGAHAFPPDLPPPSPAPGNAIWLYSGNLGRAHEWETLLDAQASLERRGSAWRLVFQGGGPAWPLVRARARELGLRQCEWRPYAPEGELRAALLRARVLVVTQRPETQGLLWPSKLGFVTTLPRQILWVGPADGAIARGLRRDFPQCGTFAPGDAVAIADWLEGLEGNGGDCAGSFNVVNAPALRTHDAAAAREASLRRWTELLRRWEQFR